MSEFDGVRYLHLGTPWVQGAMRIRKPLKLELEYIQRMMAWLLLRPAELLTEGHAVQLGLGAGAITRCVHSTLKMRCTAVELNPTVVDACRLWFHLPPESPRFEMLQMDAGAYVGDAERTQTADVLCVDLYDHEAASPVLDSAAFYADCRRTLADGGVMSVNLFGRDASFEQSLAHIAAAFGEASIASLRPTREGNTIVLAVKGEALPDRHTLTRRADNIETRFLLPARKWLRMFRPMAPLPASPSTASSQTPHEPDDASA